MPISVQHQQVDAVAVISKVVNVSAKKVAKEAIKDTAVQMSMNFVMDYKYVPKDQRKPKDGYSFVCLPKDKKTGGDCGKPMEVKLLTSTDKKVLGDKVETVLESKIAGGIGNKRWGKFLNWFFPIFTIGLGVAVLDYAMDGEVSDLFDDIALDSLKALGFLVPSVTPKPKTEIIPEPTDPIAPPGETSPDYVPPTLQYFIPENMEVSSSQLNDRDTRAEIVLRYKEGVSETYLHDLGPDVLGGERHWPVFRIIYSASYSTGYFPKTMTFTHMTVAFHYQNGTQMKIHENVEVPHFIVRRSNETMYKNEIIGMLNSAPPLPNLFLPGETAPVEVEPIPEYDQLQLPRTIPPNTVVKIPAPGSIPFTEKDTGQQLLPEKLPDGSTGFKTKTGTPVIEDNVVVGSPIIVENPDGSQIVVKQPTVDTPTPSPDDNGVIPPPKTPDTVDPEFPDGPSCDAELKLPKLLPLFTQISETFPFSIPWDLKSGFDAIFLNMGSEKPKFEYKLAFQGQEHDFSFKIPSFFDSWMPFIHSILLLTFDIGIVYAIYRFMKGGSG